MSSRENAIFPSLVPPSSDLDSSPNFNALPDMKAAKVPTRFRQSDECFAQGSLGIQIWHRFLSQWLGKEIRNVGRNFKSNFVWKEQAPHVGWSNA